MGYSYLCVVTAVCLVWAPKVHSQITKDDGECGSTKGCFFVPDDCDPDDISRCTAFASWSLQEDNKLLINLQCNTDTYIAIGFSKSGRMPDSDVYACTSEMAIKRSRNAETGYSNTASQLVGVTEEKVEVENGVLKCSFVRQLSMEGDDTFFNLSSPNMYTPILSWGGPLANGEIQRHTDREFGNTEVDFTQNSAVGGASEPLAKLHVTILLLTMLSSVLSTNILC